MEKSTKHLTLKFSIILAGTLGILFCKGAFPGYIHFSNDGPLGELSANYMKLPEAFTGGWADINSIGSNSGSTPPDFTALMFWALGPVGYLKFSVPINLFILGMGAWCFFRQLKLAPIACGCGAFAATLNMSFFASACWGVGSQDLGLAEIFFALALVESNTPETKADIRWVRIALAGLLIGQCVMEAADIGALYSILAATFILFRSLAQKEIPITKRFASGMAQVTVIACFAGFMACSTVLSLLQVTGIVK